MVSPVNAHATHRTRFIVSIGGLCTKTEALFGLSHHAIEKLKTGLPPLICTNPVQAALVADAAVVPIATLGTQITPAQLNTLQTIRGTDQNLNFAYPNTPTGIAEAARTYTLLSATARPTAHPEETAAVLALINQHLPEAKLANPAPARSHNNDVFTQPQASTPNEMQLEPDLHMF